MIATGWLPSDMGVQKKPEDSLVYANAALCPSLSGAKAKGTRCFEDLDLRGLLSQKKEELPEEVAWVETKGWFGTS